MTAPVNPQCSTEWFPKWTHNYFKLMDLKGSSILISLTLPIARLILWCQFSGCYHRKMLNHEHHTLFLWTNEGCWAHRQCACSTEVVSWTFEVTRTEKLKPSFWNGLGCLSFGGGYVWQVGQVATCEGDYAVKSEGHRCGPIYACSRTGPGWVTAPLAPGRHSWNTASRDTAKHIAT